MWSRACPKECEGFGKGERIGWEADEDVSVFYEPGLLEAWLTVEHHG